MRHPRHTPIPTPSRRARARRVSAPSLAALCAVLLAAACSSQEADSAPSDDDVATTAGWLVEETERDGGSQTVEIHREASRGANSTGIAPTLHLRCRNDTTEVSIVWYEDPEGTDNDVTTRVGSGDRVRRTWMNRNEDSSVMPRDSATIFIRRLMQADSLTVESNLYKRMPITAVFDLTGLPEAVRPVQEACGW